MHDIQIMCKYIQIHVQEIKEQDHWWIKWIVLNLDVKSQ